MAIQTNYLSIFRLLKSDYYYKAWCLLERVDIDLNSLAKHYQLDDDFKLIFIEKHIPLYQSLFPYRLFISPAWLYKEVTCSICGKTISIRNGCGHKIGEIYDGKECCRIITKSELLDLSLVENPAQKYSVLFPGISEEDGCKKEILSRYEVIRYVVSMLDSPFDEWNIEFTKTRHPHSHFTYIEPNESCPCGSGLEYRHCCLREEGVLQPHVRILLEKSPKGGLLEIKYFKARYMPKKD